MRASHFTLFVGVFSILLLPTLAGAEQPSPPAPPAPAASPPAVPPEGVYGAGTFDPGAGSAFGNEPKASPAAPSAAAALAYSASRSDTALRIEDLMRGAAALRTRGDFSKAVDLYNEALTLAPRFAEGYRQRALTLVRLGNRVEAQADYDRFLAIDPQALGRVREEITLFEQSGQARIGEAAAASYSYGAPPAGPAFQGDWLPLPAGDVPRRVGSGPFDAGLKIAESSQHLADRRISWAEDAFQRGDYEMALEWAARANRVMPQARTRALMAQILIAKGDFRRAAVDARAAAAMGPVMDWQTLLGYYGHATPRFSRQLHALEEFVRQNPSSADGHFLLGYENLILGHAQQAHAQLAIAAVIEPAIDVVATSLLAKDGVEIVRSERGLAQVPPPRGGAEVARRPTPPTSVTPSETPTPAPPAAGINRSEVIR